MKIQSLAIFILFILVQSVSAQSDTSGRQGTIKVSKKKHTDIYLSANAEFGLKGPDRFQPFPIVPGHAFPFNYTAFFMDYFKNTRIDLMKETDTVYMEVHITKKGKARIKDISYSMANGKRIAYDGPEMPVTDALHLNCFNALRQIKEWYPAYIIDPQVGKYRGQTVVKPVKTNIECTGIIRIVFSAEPTGDE